MLFFPTSLVWQKEDVNPDAVFISRPRTIVCGNSKKTYNLDKFISLFRNEIKSDDLYKGYYLHLIQDMIFRNLVYCKYKWNPTIPGTVLRLHNDYRLLNVYLIK